MSKHSCVILMESHGGISLSWQGTILIVKANGPFNEEGINDVFEAVKKTVVEQNFDNWSRLSICDKETLGTPESLELLIKIHKWCEVNGCSKLAVVTSNTIQHSLAEKLFNCNCNVFTDEAKALLWLQEVW